MRYGKDSNTWKQLFRDHILNQLIPYPNSRHDASYFYCGLGGGLFFGEGETFGEDMGSVPTQYGNQLGSYKFETVISV